MFVEACREAGLTWATAADVAAFERLASDLWNTTVIASTLSTVDWHAAAEWIKEGTLRWGPREAVPKD